MFNIDAVRNALAALGAIMFTVTAVGAAAGPARLVETAPVVYAGSAPLVEGAGHA